MHAAFQFMDALILCKGKRVCLFDFQFPLMDPWKNVISGLIKHYNSNFQWLHRLTSYHQGRENRKKFLFLAANPNLETKCSRAIFKERGWCVLSISFNLIFPVNWMFSFTTPSAWQTFPKWFSSGSQRNNTAYVEVMPSLQVCSLLSWLSCLYCNSLFCLVFCLFFNFLFILLSQCLLIFQLLIIPINISLLAMFCSLVFMSSRLMLAPWTDTLFSWPLKFLVVLMT